MKKTFIAGILVLSVLAFPVAGKAQLLDAIQQALIAAIKAADIAVQKAQSATIDLQNAQKTIENELSKLNLGEIGDWEQKTRDLYSEYYDELKKVKSAISYFKEISAIIAQQKQLVGEYKQAFALVQKDNHFSPSEVSYIYGVYSGIISESVKDLDQILLVLTDFSLQMTDVARLKVIKQASINIENETTDLRAFNSRTAQLSLQRAKNQEDINTVKRLYGIGN